MLRFGLVVDGLKCWAVGFEYGLWAPIFPRGPPEGGELRYEGSKEEGKAPSCQWESMVTVRSQCGHSAVTVRSTVRSQYGLIFPMKNAFVRS